MASVRSSFIVATVLLAVGALVVPVSLAAPSVATAAPGVSEPQSTGSGVGSAVCIETINREEFTTGTPTRACPGTSDSLPAGPSAAWKLAWSDEFDARTVDTTKWNVLNNSTYGDGNAELACLTSRPTNVRVADGTLVIAAQRENGLRCGTNDKRFLDGRSYSSGHLETKGKASFEYGRFEVRAKTPIAYGQSKGMWPAFWLRPMDGGIGELDVFESMGAAPGEKDTSNRTEQTIHYDYVKTHPKQNQNYKLPTGSFADGFHDYAVEWEPGAIRWYIDGVLTYQRTKATTPWIDEAFSGQFYLRLNLAIGGPVGVPAADTRFPGEMVVDYVRVYQRR